MHFSCFEMILMIRRTSSDIHCVDALTV